VPGLASAGIGVLDDLAQEGSLSRASSNLHQCESREKRELSTAPAAAERSPGFTPKVYIFQVTFVTLQAHGKTGVFRSIPVIPANFRLRRIKQVQT
jgi:hypothetical protein